MVDGQMRIAGGQQDTIGKQRHAILGHKRLAVGDSTKLASKHWHERHGKVLRHQDRNADALRQRLEQHSERMDSTSRSTDREHVDGIVRHGAERTSETGGFHRREGRLAFGVPKCL